MAERRRLNDLQAFYESMQPVQVSERGTYTREDRYRDFREVFFGSEAGRRVLSQIVAESEGLPITLNQLSDHAYLAFRHGKREVGLKIVQWMDAVPPDPVIETQEDE